MAELSGGSQELTGAYAARRASGAGAGRSPDCTLRRRRHKTSATPRAARATTPATTPPTIAPVLFWVLDCEFPTSKPGEVEDAGGPLEDFEGPAAGVEGGGGEPGMASLSWVIMIVSKDRDDPVALL